MAKNIYSLFMTLFLLGTFSFNVIAASNNSLQSLKTIAVEVDIPTGGAYGDLIARGVTKVKLEDSISKQLQAAGFKMIGVNDAQNDPSAALIEVRIRVINSLGVVYSTSVNVTTSYYADAWTGNVNTGLSQNDLPSINTYAKELIDDFIKIHQAQN